MNTPQPISLSLKKQLSDNPQQLEISLQAAFENLKVASLLRSCGIFKEKGIPTFTVLFWIVMLPFLKLTLTSLWSSSYITKQLDVQKDTYYRFLNNERFNWRKLVYKLAVKVIALADQVPHSQKVIIVDDTVINKTGKDMEMVSHHFSHKDKKSVLGHQCLQLGYHNGVQFFPVDAAFHTSSKRPNNNLRDIDKRTCGWKRRQEGFRKKTDMLVQMLKNAWSFGFDAACVVFDSWFSYDAVISQVVATGYNVVCRLKNNNVKYKYNGKDYTLKELWKQFARKQQRWIPGYQIKGCCLIVSLPLTGEVKLLITSDGRNFYGFLSTDTSLEASQILGYYSIRWAIEVYFKDAKQMLYLGKEQSKTFDAVVASYSIVMIRYLLLVYVMNSRRLTGPLGPLFRHISDTEVMLQVAGQLWEHIKHAMLKSIHIFLTESAQEYIIHIIDIIEDTMFSPPKITTAKL